jgi:hypothetical protein
VVDLIHSSHAGYALLWKDFCMIPHRLEEHSNKLSQQGQHRDAAYYLQFALVFGLYAATCPVRGKEFYALPQHGIVSRKTSLTIHFEDFKNVKKCGDKWKIITRESAIFGWLIDVAQRVFSKQCQNALRGETSCDRAIVTITGQPFTESYWSSTICSVVNKHCCKNLQHWRISVDVIRAAFITVFLNGNPSTHDVQNVAFAMNTSVEMIYKIYDRFYFCLCSFASSTLNIFFWQALFL